MYSNGVLFLLHLGCKHSSSILLPVKVKYDTKRGKCDNMSIRKEFSDLELVVSTIVACLLALLRYNYHRYGQLLVIF